MCAVRGLRRTRAAGGRGLDCALVACGLLVWLLVDFAYADIGGPATVLTAVCFGLIAWWALVGGDRVTSGIPPRTAVSAGRGGMPEEVTPR